MPTPRTSFENRKTQAKDAFELKSSDGLNALVLKGIFKLPFWRCLFHRVIPLFLFVSSVQDHDYEDEKDADAKVRRAMDVYLWLWMAGQVLIYYCVVSLAHTQFKVPDLNNVLMVLLAIVSSYHFFEQLSVLAQLHLRVPYQSPDPVRALIGAIWYYFETIIVFAIFFVLVAHFSGDPFCKAKDGCPEFISEINPLYFSLVTMATIGYGDFAPQQMPGQLLVCFEFMVAVVITVIAIQRALTVASTEDGQQPPPQQPPPQQPPGNMVPP